MSAWLDATLAAINTVAIGNGTDPAIQAAIATLNTQMSAVNVSDGEFQQAITALVNKLAASTPTETGALPVLTSISPANGSIAGGELITISGTGFTGATGVIFGSVAGTNLTVVSDTQITVTSPAQAAAAVPVTVTTPAGTSSVGSASTYTLA